MGGPAARETDTGTFHGGRKKGRRLDSRLRGNDDTVQDAVHGSGIAVRQAALWFGFRRPLPGRFVFQKVNKRPASAAKEDESGGEKHKNPTRRNGREPHAYIGGQLLRGVTLILPYRPHRDNP